MKEDGDCVREDKELLFVLEGRRDEPGVAEGITVAVLHGIFWRALVKEHSGSNTHLCALEMMTLPINGVMGLLLRMTEAEIFISFGELQLEMIESSLHALEGSVGGEFFTGLTIQIYI